MKKITLAAAALVLCMCSACAAKTDSAAEVTVTSAADNTKPSADIAADKGLDVIKNINALASDEEYVSLFTPEDNIKEKVKDVGDHDFSSPRAIYKLTDISMYDLPEISSDENIKNKVENRMLQAVPNKINSLEGVEFIAATSILTDSDSFIDPALKEKCIYLYLYEGEYCAMVCFIPGSEDIVNASGSIVKNDVLSEADSAEDIENFPYVKIGKAEKIK